MKDQLTGDQIASYRENGFLVIEGFLSQTELAHWQKTTQEAVDQRLESQGGLTNRSDPESYYSQVFTQCLKLADTHPGMREMMLDPRLGKIIATLACVEGIRIWHDQALFKPPFGNPTAWHLDNPYWSFSSHDSLSIWVALDDATKDNGCLYYLPGTHKKAHYETVGIGQNLADLFKVYPEWRTIDPVGCPCPAGSAVVHNGLTAHGAGANMTNRPRRAMTCAYMPDGSTFNGTQNILPGEYFASLKVGDLLNDDIINPKVWP
ncbi:MAG TPA: phytanoyl-CoA dioxygenase family protein [Capsulimonadaceae bacterium]|nr:phytanoyl-CoA dioxygenase family protein [Capsulimonadaceae bacterium]